MPVYRQYRQTAVDADVSFCVGMGWPGTGDRGNSTFFLVQKNSTGFAMAIAFRWKSYAGARRPELAIKAGCYVLYI
jgi:hypothetical protein